MPPTAVRLRETGCLRRSIHNQRSPWPGFDPAIYVSLGFGDPGGQDVDARNESTAVRLRKIGCLQRSIHNQRSPWPGLTRPSTSSWALVISAAKTWMPGTSPGKGYLQLHRGSHRSILHCFNCLTGQPWNESGQGYLQLHRSSRRSIPHRPDCSTGQPRMPTGKPVSDPSYLSDSLDSS
jgi:hypothetical protein